MKTSLPLIPEFWVLYQATGKQTNTVTIDGQKLGLALRIYVKDVLKLIV